MTEVIAVAAPHEKAAIAAALYEARGRAVRVLDVKVVGLSGLVSYHYDVTVEVNVHAFADDGDGECRTCGFTRTYWEHEETRS